MIQFLLRLFWREIVRRRPTVLNQVEDPFFFSASKIPWDIRYAKGVGGWFPCRNHSGGYHGLLQQFWKHYGLGKTNLLVSETIDVANDFHAAFPDTKFIATDFFLDLHEGLQKTHVVWNLYEDPPRELRVDSILFQATLEHLMDPVGVMNRLASLLNPEGLLYVHTQCPLFPYHPWPKDYLRFHPEWFVDIPTIVKSLNVLEVVCAYNHAFAVYKRTTT